MKILFRNLSRPNGQALIEFAFVITVLALILMGIFDLGRVVYTQAALSNAVREGARKAMIVSNESTIKTAAAANAPATGLQTTNISVSYPGSSDTGCSVNVRAKGCPVQISIINYNFQAITPMIGAIFGTSDNTFPMALSTQTMVEVK